MGYLPILVDKVFFSIKRQIINTLGFGGIKTVVFTRLCHFGMKAFIDSIKINGRGHGSIELFI